MRYLWLVGSAGYVAACHVAKHQVQWAGGGRLSEAASRARALATLATATTIATATLRTPIPGRAAIESVANRPLSRIASSISRPPGRNPLETGSRGVPSQRGNCLHHVIRGAIPER